jgi:ABC-type antimicrobial peptide transport system permease subunit
MQNRNSNTSNATANTSGGVGFFGALTILFIALKLLGFIKWSWLWVLSPLWLPLAILLTLLLIGLIIFLVYRKVTKKTGL